MITKKVADHEVVANQICGTIHNILRKSDYYGVNVSVALDIKPTVAHFHRSFDEIYFVLDGELDVRLHDPAVGRTWDEHLSANELCLIEKGTHHVITATTPGNRLCVLMVPYFDPADETPSDVI